MTFRKSWQKELKSSNRIYEWCATIIVLIALVSIMPLFMEYIEGRNSTLLYDPVLALWSATDLSFIIFSVMYLCIIATIIQLVREPSLLLKGLQTYVILLLARMVCIYLTPLSPPEGMIVLDDPIVDTLIGVSGKPITKDLFFSGHTATMVLLALLYNGKGKLLMLVSATFVGLMLLFQHVHYTIDVVVAPVFTCLSWYVVNLKSNRNHS